MGPQLGARQNVQKKNLQAARKFGQTFNVKCVKVWSILVAFFGHFPDRLVGLRPQAMGLTYLGFVQQIFPFRWPPMAVCEWAGLSVFLLLK